MKFATIALLSAFSVAPAFAGTIAFAPNADQTAQIRLTDGTSKTCEKLDAQTSLIWQYAELTSNNGRVDSRGCWTRDNGTDEIRVRWSDGDEWNYGHKSKFQLTDYWRRTYGDDTPKKAKPTRNGSDV